MSEIIESWSLPWHAMLHSLANEFDDATSGGAAKTDSAATRAAGTRLRARAPRPRRLAGWYVHEVLRR